MKKLYLALWSLLALLAATFVCLIVDSSGPVRWTYGTVVSAHFEDGVTVSNDIKVGDVTVPMKTEVPGAWIVGINSPILGKIEVPTDNKSFHAGQEVYLGYRVGRLTGCKGVVTLQSRPSIRSWFNDKVALRCSPNASFPAST
jgi:hypothetical protein